MITTNYSCHTSDSTRRLPPRSPAEDEYGFGHADARQSEAFLIMLANVRFPAGVQSTTTDRAAERLDVSRGFAPSG
jgi:hypothetical protein